MNSINFCQLVDKFLLDTNVTGYYVRKLAVMKTNGVKKLYRQEKYSPI